MTSFSFYGEESMTDTSGVRRFPAMTHERADLIEQRESMCAFDPRDASLVEMLEIFAPTKSSKAKIYFLALSGRSFIFLIP